VEVIEVKKKRPFMYDKILALTSDILNRYVNLSPATIRP
jgi:hypothetical protein